MHGWIAFGKHVHGEIGLGKEVVHFVAHLETLGSDAWSDDGMEVFGACAIGGLEHVDVAFDDALQGPFPSGMHSRNHMGGVVPQEDGDAVGSANTNAEVGELGGEGIHSVEGKGLFERVFVDESIVNDKGVGFMHLVEGHEETGDGNGNTAISCGGEGGDMGRGRVDEHGVVDN